eukprot:3336772-Pleurochrysis_carterae.AAC.1
MLPGSCIPAKCFLGASGTPSLSRSSASDTSSAVAQSCAALLPGRSRSWSSALRQPLPVTPPAGRVTA